MMDPLTRLSLGIAGAAVGGAVLLLGRKYYWLLLGVISMMLAAYLMATLLGLENEVLLVTGGNWQAVLIALGVGALGLVLGRRNYELAVAVIGFVAGVYLAALFDHIFLYISGRTDVALPWWLLAVYLAIGMLGAYLTRRSTAEALILISVALGASIINKALGLPNDSSLTAVLMLSLALVGIVVQYAAYMREAPPPRTVLPAVPAPASDELPFD